MHIDWFYFVLLLTCWMFSSLIIFTLTWVPCKKFLLIQDHKCHIRKIICSVPCSSGFHIWVYESSQTTVSATWFSLCPQCVLSVSSHWSHAPMGHPLRARQTISTPQGNRAFVGIIGSSEFPVGLWAHSLFQIRVLKRGLELVNWEILTFSKLWVLCSHWAHGTTVAGFLVWHLTLSWCKALSHSFQDNSSN